MPKNAASRTVRPLDALMLRPAAEVVLAAGAPLEDEPLAPVAALVERCGERREAETGERASEGTRRRGRRRAHSNQEANALLFFKKKIRSAFVEWE